MDWDPVNFLPEWLLIRNLCLRQGVPTMRRCR